MTLIYFVCLIGAASLWFVTSADLGFLAHSLRIEPPWLDLSLMLFFFSAAFFGGILQLYNLADRGLSLRILIDFAEADSRIIDIDWLVANYGGGKGLAWMYGKRITGMLETNLVERKAEMIELTSKGVRAAAVLFPFVASCAWSRHRDAHSRIGNAWSHAGGGPLRPVREPPAHAAATLRPGRRRSSRPGCLRFQPHTARACTGAGIRVHQATVASRTWWIEWRIIVGGGKQAALARHVH
jgi:hypothetical protein